MVARGIFREQLRIPRSRPPSSETVTPPSQVDSLTGALIKRCAREPPGLGLGAEFEAKYFQHLPATERPDEEHVMFFIE